MLSGYFYLVGAVDGTPGDRGQLPYPAGDYDRSKEYTCTKQVAPYVACEGLYYGMQKICTWQGSLQAANVDTPKKDYAVNKSNATWLPFENYKAIWIEVLMANFGKIASAVFHGNYMFSQQGYDANGNATSDYSKFGTDAFNPNILLDFLTGKAKFNDAEVTGEVNASTGRIGDLIIRKNQLVGVVNGVEKVGVSIDEIPPLSEMFQNKLIAGSDANYTASVYYNTDIGTGSITNEFTHSFTLPFPSMINYDYQDGINVSYGTFSGSIETYIRIFVDGVDHGALHTNISYPAGQVVLKITVRAVGNYQANTFEGTVYFSSQGFLYRIAPAKTIQGVNGLMSMFSQTDYFYTREGWGTEIRNANGGLRVVNGVAQVMRNGTWINL